MYSHLAKGYTVGHTVMRLILRNIFSVPGILIDCMVAIFWLPDYFSYWKDAGISYLDGTRVGIAQGLFGWIGEALGFVIGAPLGILVGFAIFFPNSILQVAAWLQRKTYELLDKLAAFIGEAGFFEKFIVFDKPANYFQSAWNIGAGVLGGVLAAGPYLAFKMIEFFFPFMGDFLSNFVLWVANLIGGSIVGALSVPLFPVKHLVAKLMDMVDSIRDAIQHGIAILYAKNNQSLANTDDGSSCVPNESIHSAAFRNDVNEIKNTTWSRLLFGPLKSDGVVPIGGKNDIDQYQDVITHESLGANGMHIVTDREGHSFNDDPNGIHQWLKNHRTCPIGREPLHEGRLNRNRLAEDLLKGSAVPKR